MYKNSKIILLAAYANNRLIGNEQGIPWKNDPDCVELVESDISRLRSMIQGSTVILGRKTYEEICEIPSDPIENAWNAQVIVMSRDPAYKVRHPERARSANSLDNALESALFQPIYILGGTEVYNEFLNVDGLVDRMELTVIDRDYGSEGCCFPVFKASNWQREMVKNRKTSSGVTYRFVRYDHR
ncbi:hypothetical protein CL619_00380 [archaeon]|nr:hypothetical protein [archaeon]|tara:strand:- start:665 stop:1219 length:555 start_codon:yes stop_codon:yes gene_type:complete